MPVSLLEPAHANGAVKTVKKAAFALLKYSNNKRTREVQWQGWAMERAIIVIFDG